MEGVNPFFSVIIPVYNSAKYLNKCISSILCQKYQNYEIIFVDDGSTDDSVGIISKQIQGHANFKLIEQKNQGVSSARNNGLKNSTGSYVMFMDSDDYWTDDIMNRLNKILSSHENVDILLFNYFEDISNTKKDHFISSRFLEEKLSKNLAIESILSNKGYLGYCWNKVFKRSCILDNKFDENITYLEDMLFNISCILNADEIMSIDDCLYAYRWRSNSVVNTFEPAHMTFFDSLDKIDSLVPTEFHDAITIKKKSACIEFASRFIFKDQKKYNFFKNKFNQEKRITQLSRFGLLKTGIITLSLGNISFTISVIAFILIQIIKRIIRL